MASTSSSAPAASDAAAKEFKHPHADKLRDMIERSSATHDVTQTIHSHIPFLGKLKWLPGLEKLAAKYHWGNFVAVRRTNDKIFESMPIYARIGMHLVFYGKGEREAVHLRSIERLFQEESIKQGRIYDDPKSVHSIPSFIKTYSIRTDELLYPDLKDYKTFNEFFYRKLNPNSRPVEKADDPAYFCCAADSRVTVFSSVDLAKKFWIKGQKFTVPNLLNIPADSEQAKSFDGCSLAIFRLAPQDYHRFHSPLDGIVGDVLHIPGQYYTVNPMAVNEPGFDVFVENARSVLTMTHTATGRPIAFVAVGALLVGSIKWTAGGEKDKAVKRGEDLGYFAYGGSTCIVLFPKGVIEFDEDLQANSKKPIETLVKVGWSLGRIPAAPAESPPTDTKP